MIMKISLVLAVFITIASAKIDPKNLKCLVCRTIFLELDKTIKSIHKWKKVDVGNFRMDAEGNTNQLKVDAHRSAMYISELIDDICKKMDDYVRVYYKSSGKLAIMQMITDEGMNPDFSKAKIVTDDDLNKSLEYYCERMFEENEEEITDLYVKRPEDDVMPNAERDICFKHTGYCEEWMLPTAEDTTWTSEMESEYVKIHGSDPYGFGGLSPQQQYGGGQRQDDDEEEDDDWEGGPEEESEAEAPEEPEARDEL